MGASHASLIAPERVSSTSSPSRLAEIARPIVFAQQGFHNQISLALQWPKSDRSHVGVRMLGNAGSYFGWLNAIWPSLGLIMQHACHPRWPTRDSESCYSPACRRVPVIEVARFNRKVVDPSKFSIEPRDIVPEDKASMIYAILI
jgi:hypothetical protein